MIELFDMYYRLIGCPFVVIVDGEVIVESKIFQFTTITRGADDSIKVQAVIAENLKTYPLNCIRLKANGLLFKIQEI
jgi:hypothetical protein